MKRCPTCGETKPRTEFTVSRARHDGLSAYCRSCNAATQRRYRERNHEHAKALQRAWAKANPEKKRLSELKARGLTPEKFAQMLADQNGLCDVCGKDFTTGRIAIDHDHRCCPGRYSCGKCLRGLLHSTCNSGLGLFKEDPAALAGAIRYLAKYGIIELPAGTTLPD